MQLFLLLLFFSPLVAEPWTVGNSGAPGTQSCASSCHGDGTGSLEVHGFPTEYYPDSSYLIRLTSTDLPIKNFNASCRIGTSSLNAGVMIGEGMTANYSVPNESNGVHALVLDQDTLDFTWIAPVHGTGEVRLYIAAHQGHDTGPNNDLMLVAEEFFVQQPPDTPSHPFPPDNSAQISLHTLLSWDEVVGADSFRIYFGPVTPPPFVGVQTGLTFDPGTLDYITIYSWRIEAVNEAGITSGPEWSFSTEWPDNAREVVAREFMLSQPYPNPFNGATTIELDVTTSSPIEISIYDVRGRLVENLFTGQSPVGHNEFIWRPQGAAGVYFIQARILNQTEIFKVLYLK